MCLQQIKKHFEKYELDTFYQSIRFMVDYLYFEYYQKTGNTVRADHYYKIINKDVPEIAFKPVFSFYVTQYLESKLERFLQNNNIEELTDLNADLESQISKWISMNHILAFHSAGSRLYPNFMKEIIQVLPESLIAYATNCR